MFNVACRMCAAAVAAVLAAQSAFADARTWSNTGSFTSPGAAADFYASGNWEGGLAPSSSDSAWFYNCPAGSQWTFIKSDRDVDAVSLFTCNTSYGNARKVAVISDAGFTSAAASGKNGTWIGPTLYGNVTLTGKMLAWTGAVCGDFVSTVKISDVYDGGMKFASGDFEHRVDRYANSTAAERTAMSIGSVYQGDGSLNVYGPQSSAGQVQGSWNQTAGSPYLTPAAGTSHPLAVGTAVSGDGVPSGTFLKRVFPDGTIELSNPIEDGKTLSANTLTFEPFTPVVHEYVGRWTVGSSQSLRLNAYRDEDTLEFKIGTLTFTAASKTLTVNTFTGYRPGNLVLDGSPTGKGKLQLVECHVTLSSNEFPSVVVAFPTAGKTARLTVGDGTSVEFGRVVDSLLGNMVKDGAGTLALAFTNDASRCTGAVSVEEGVLELGCTTADMPYVGTLSVSSGATIRVTSAGLRAGQATFAPGSEVTGPGTLVVPAGTDVSGVAFGPETSLRFEGASASVNWNLPAEDVPGTPALWLDASKIESLTLDGNSVKRWDDVRGSSYAFATNSNENYIPTYVMSNMVGKLHYVNFAYGNTSGSTTLEKSQVLVWDKPVSGIRMVFLVQDVSQGGGDILGSTPRVSAGKSYGDFARPGGQSWSFSMVWTSSPCADVLNAKCYQDGIPCQATSPYNSPRSFTSNDNKTYILPTVTEIHPVGAGATADCFGYDFGTKAVAGQRICECIVYTNALSETERLAVSHYLAKKWRKSEPAWYELSEASIDALDGRTGPNLVVADGESVLVRSVRDGSFSKGGGGTLTVGELNCPSGTLSVRGGTMVVRSGVDESVLPDNAYMHVDASKTNTVTFSVTAANELRVSKWKDVRQESTMGAQVYNNQTNYPVLKQVAGLCNRHVIDFGTFRTSYNTLNWGYVSLRSKGASSAMQLTSNDSATSISRGLRTGFWILGSANGGGSLLGSYESGYNEGYGIQRGGSLLASTLLRKKSDYNYPSWFLPAFRDVRVNGVQTDVEAASPLSGGYDIVTFSVFDPFGAKCFALNHYGYWGGGQELGEVVLYRDKLSSNTIDRVEAYLRRKWFGQETAGYRAATAQAVDIAPGATLEVRGEPLSVKTLSGSGTIRGAVSLRANAEIAVTVEQDGSLGTSLSVDGAIDLSGGGTVRVSGALGKATVGRHVILSSASITGASAANWSLAVDGAGRRHYSLQAVDGFLVVDVSKDGLTFIVR